MDNYLITVVFLSFLTKTVLTEADLQQQNADQDQLNPLNDYENADNSAKDQEKRTIFGTGAHTYAFAKHVGYHPSGFRYVLGYTPLNLKYAPLIRPLAIKNHGYIYGKPKLHLHLKKPVVQVKVPKPVYGVPWKPTVVKPVVPVLPSPVNVGAVAVPKPVHVDQVHHVDHVHTVPHFDHVHKVPVHVDHVHSVAQPVHVHPVPLQPVAPLPVPQPVLPAPQPLLPALAPAQFIPSPLFEVTKPDLGVLPFGAVFPSPILKGVEAPPVPVLRPAFHPQPVAPAAFPLPQPQPALIPAPQSAVFPLPQAPVVPVGPPAVGPPQVIRQPAYPPGTVVEFHGTTGFINLAQGRAPVLPQTPVNAVQPLPPQYYLRYPYHQNIPVHAHEQHDAQVPLIPASPPNIFHQSAGQPQFQQQLPQDAPSHFQPIDQANVFQQQLPVDQQTQFQSDLNSQGNFFQQQVPQDVPAHFQPADQGQHFFQQPVDAQQGQFQPVDQSGGQSGGYIYERPDATSAQQSLQPGQTDLQLPVHLPHHAGFVQSSRQFQPGNVHDPSQFSESIFRPSIQLEPPYKK